MKSLDEGDDINITSGGDLTMHAANDEDPQIIEWRYMLLSWTLMVILEWCSSRSKMVCRVFEKSFVGTDKIKAADCC